LHTSSPTPTANEECKERDGLIARRKNYQQVRVVEGKNMGHSSNGRESVFILSLT
jgi:hypothetical protein